MRELEEIMRKENIRARKEERKKSLEAFTPDQKIAIMTMNTAFRQDARKTDHVIPIAEVHIDDMYQVEFGIFPIHYEDTRYPIDGLSLSDEQIEDLKKYKRVIFNGRTILPLKGMSDMHKEIIGRKPENEDIVIGAMVVNQNVSIEEIPFLKYYGECVADALQHGMKHAQMRYINELYMDAIATIAHDLKAPLITVQNFSGLLENLIEESLSKEFDILKESITQSLSKMDECIMLSSEEDIDPIRLKELTKETFDYLYKAHGAYSSLDQTMNKRFKDYLNRISSSILIGWDMVSDYLNLAEIEEGKEAKKKKINLFNDIINPLFNTSYTILKVNGVQSPAYNKDDLEDITVEVDPNKMRSVFMNAITNLRYSDKNKQSSIHVEDRDSSYLIHVSSPTNERLEDEDIDNMFRRFSRGRSSDNKGKGSGLGTFIMQRWSRLNGGDAYANLRDGPFGQYFVMTIEIPKTKTNL